MIHQGERATIISIINEVTQKECIEVFTPVKVIVAETTRPTIIVHNAHTVSGGASNQRVKAEQSIKEPALTTMASQRFFIQLVSN